MQTRSGYQISDYYPKRCSFILPTKNRSKRLEKALKLCVKLVKPQDELIIVDGGSTDNTFKIIKKYKKIIDLFISEPDRDLTEAFNKGILLSKGRYIKNLNDDDTIESQAMEKAISILDLHPEIDILVCGGIRYVNGQRYPFYVPPHSNYGSSIYTILQYGACGVGFIINHKALALIGLIPTLASGDIAFIFQAINQHAIVKFCRIKLFHHPIYKHSTIVKRKSSWWQEYNQLVKQYLTTGQYINYQIKQTISFHPINLERLYAMIPVTRALLFPLRQIYQRILNKLISNNTLRQKDYLWDGGFS